MHRNARPLPAGNQLLSKAVTYGSEVAMPFGKVT